MGGHVLAWKIGASSRAGLRSAAASAVTCLIMSIAWAGQRMPHVFRCSISAAFVAPSSSVTLRSGRQGAHSNGPRGARLGSLVGTHAGSGGKAGPGQGVIDLLRLVAAPVSDLPLQEPRITHLYRPHRGQAALLLGHEPGPCLRSEDLASERSSITAPSSRPRGVSRPVGRYRRAQHQAVISLRLREHPSLGPRVDLFGPDRRSSRWRCSVGPSRGKCTGGFRWRISRADVEAGHQSLGGRTSS